MSRTGTYYNCADCDGLGFAPTGGPCPACSGKGGFVVVIESGTGVFLSVTPCSGDAVLGADGAILDDA